MTLTFILLATLGLSLIALVSSSILSFFPSFLKKSTLYLVALAAGTMLGTGLFDLLPESAHELGLEVSLLVLAATFAGLLGAEKIFHWHHCHDEDCENRPLGYINLLGDALHNFLDGVLIAAAFGVSPQIGLVTTLAFALHELPQEIGDFGVLLHAGFTRSQAVVANLAVGITSVLGGLVGFFLLSSIQDTTVWLLPVAAGSFLYLAAVDLIPEFREESNRLRSVVLFLLFIVGLFGLPVVNQIWPGLHEHGVHEETHQAGLETVSH